MPLTLNRTSAPSLEPLTTAEAKSHLRVDGSNDDALIDALITASREHVEETTRRALITQTWELSLDCFPSMSWPRSGSVIWIPRSPLQSVTKIDYVNTAGTTETLDASRYRVDSKSEPARVTEAENENWPLTDGVTNAVTVEFEAGYGDDASDVPQGIKQAMLLLIGHWYENREAAAPENLSEHPKAVDALLAPYRVYL